jgi:hypothetical protein
MPRLGHRLSSFTVLSSNAPCRGSCLLGSLLHITFTPRQYTETPTTIPPIGLSASLGISYVHQPYLYNTILPVCLSSWIACPWRWRHHKTSKYQELPAHWHNITFQKTQILIVTDIPYSINNLFSKHITTLNISWYYFTPVKGKYSHAPHNDISINNGPHIW